VFWCFGVLVFWCFGVLVFWCFGVLVFWCFGVLVFWCFFKVKGAQDRGKLENLFDYLRTRFAFHEREGKKD
jgi:hypothetical protein